MKFTMNTVQTVFYDFVKINSLLFMRSNCTCTVVLIIPTSCICNIEIEIKIVYGKAVNSEGIGDLPLQPLTTQTYTLRSHQNQAPRMIMPNIFSCTTVRSVHKNPIPHWYNYGSYNYRLVKPHPFAHSERVWQLDCEGVAMQDPAASARPAPSHKKSWICPWHTMTMRIRYVHE